jgi:hypothetical protein
LIEGVLGDIDCVRDSEDEFVEFWVEASEDVVEPAS